MYALKILVAQPQRAVLTCLGIALCVVLMLFLLAVYRGVSVGSLEYVRSSDADLWVLQRHAANILRSTSLLSERHGDVIKKIEGVESASPVLFLLGGVERGTAHAPRLATTYFTGFDVASGRGGPPALAAGRDVVSDSEIVLDRSFAAKYRLRVGDRLSVKGETLRVVGLSAGTNMFVIQYAFVTLNRARLLAGMKEMVSAYQVRVRPGADPAAVRTSIRRELRDVAVYDRQTFLANNGQEMRSGILPLLYTVAIIGAAVLTAILSLILSVNVLERRKELAVMKALGAPAGFIPGLVVVQAFCLAGAGTVLGTGAFFPLSRLVERLSPEITALAAPAHIAIVVAGAIAVSLLSSLLPIQRLRRIYPLEVFR
jgi:ABC-type antimicrobial peptide transport system permease subunit